MRPVDCPGESRMRENLMSGLGRGSRKRGSPPRLLPTSPAVRARPPTNGLIAQAVVETVLGFSAPAGAGRGWFFFSGFASLVLGVLIIAQWPVSSIWAIGTMVGAGVLFNGITRIVMSTWVRSEARQFQRSSAAA